MGVTGTISLEDNSGNQNKTRNFPTFRFPELAVNALGRIVRYVEFRRQPLGKLVWYEDIKADEARGLIHSVLTKESPTQQIIKLGENTSEELMKYFGIQTIDIKPLNL